MRTLLEDVFGVVKVTQMEDELKLKTAQLDVMKKETGA